MSLVITEDESMTSVFGWMATDAEQSRRMMEVVDQFRDSTTIDDLGLGGIRDAFSDTLFPGTSTLHTRIRYALFVPWLMQLASDRNETVPEMSGAFARSEFQLTQSLLNGGESAGVIGRVAGGPQTQGLGRLLGNALDLGSNRPRFHHARVFRTLHTSARA